MKPVTSRGSLSSSQRAFTLVEIMIAVAIVAILTAIALPAYNSYIFKSEIRAAQADLLSLTLKLENQYQRTLSYPVLPGNKKDTTAGIEEVLKGWSANSTNFNIKFETNTATAYKITAEGISSSRQKDCKISITQDNTRTTATCKHITNGKWL